VLTLTVWLGPLLVAILGFDAVSAEVQHRSVRYWTVRARRWSYMVGKFLGLWAIVSAMTLSMHAFIWILVVARGDATFGTTLAWGLRFWAVTLPISAAWCGIATLVGSLFRSPILALLVTFASFFVLWLAWIIGGVSGAEPMMYAYPNFYEEWLLSPRIERAGLGLAACVAFAAATFSMLAGYLQPTNGEVEVLGFDPSNVDELRSRLGVLPQDALLPAADKVGEFLLHMARLQNIPKEKAEAQVREVLAEVDGRD